LGIVAGIADKSEVKLMIRDSAQQPFGERNALLEIAVGGLSSGVLDLLQVCILSGWDMPLYIAGGLLGPKAFQGGVGAYVLGVLLHFCVALSMTAVYYTASRRLLFLTEHPLVCGLCYGAAAKLVMILIVLPLSALHERGPTNFMT
jgi:hypothetical protein